MPDRPDIAALAKDAFGREPGKEHALHAILHDEDSGRIVLVPTDSLEPDPGQPRKHFDPASLADLTASVKEKGILQPIIVRKKPHADGCIIIAGERRWRAAKAAGLVEIPALVRGAADALEVALIENLQRENLNPIEEAEGLLRLKQERGYTDAQLAKIIGKSRVSVTESLSLNQLPEAIKDECRRADKWSRRQLLQALRAGPPEKVLAVWHAMHSGELTTREQIRGRARVLRGRPKHARFTYAARDRNFHLTLTFRKTTATHRDAAEALKVVLRNLRDLHA